MASANFLFWIFSIMFLPNFCPREVMKSIKTCFTSSSRSHDEGCQSWNSFITWNWRLDPIWRIALSVKFSSFLEIFLLDIKLFLSESKTETFVSKSKKLDLQFGNKTEIEQRCPLKLYNFAGSKQWSDKVIEIFWLSDWNIN